MRALYEMKKISSFLILIFFDFTLTACSQSTDLERENFSATFQSDISSEGTLSSKELPSNDTEWQDELEVTDYGFKNKTGRILHQETEDGNVVILYDKQDQIIDTIDVIEKTSINELTDDLFEIVQSVGSPARYVFYYDAQTCQISDVFFNPILIENQYIACIKNGELIIRDIFDEGIFCKKITRDFIILNTIK